MNEILNNVSSILHGLNCKKLKTLTLNITHFYYKHLKNHTNNWEKEQ